MIKQTNKTRDEIILSIPDDAVVLDIGGATEPYRRANWLIDIVAWEGVKVGVAKGPGDIRFSKERYVQHDICSRTSWPFADKQFDYSICSHVLEDIRDPLWVCSEIIRTSKAGYIEIPSRLYETIFGLEAKNLAGASHHRWIVDLFKSKLRFTFKYMHVHSRKVNKNRKHFNIENPEMYLCLEWLDSFDFYENWLNSGKEIFEFYLDRPISEKEKWTIFRDIQDRPLPIRWLAYLKNVRNIKLDTDSYDAHDKNFTDFHTAEFVQNKISEYDEQRQFEDGGYARALKKFTHRKLHVDIGSGIGWLIRKTSPLFEKVIGVEPSAAAVDVAQKVLSDYKNISFINKPMLDAFIDIPLTDPVFFTTSTVFSHISDRHVAAFLSLLRSAPDSSTLYFDENYDTNINHKLWRIRNKEWWAKNLPDWELTFLEHPHEEYLLGIYGEKVGRKYVTNSYVLPLHKKVLWHIHGVLNLAIKVVNKILKTHFPLITLKQ